MFDIEKIRADFPILSEQVNGKPFVYFDSASTAQKPKRVIDSIVNFYTKQNSNIHRGVHTLSVQATERYENAREVIQHFVNASNKEEIIFTKGTTESINFVAQCFGEKLLHKNDEILLSQMEHHSNLVPWQLIAQKYQCFLKYVPITESGALNLQELSNIITSKTKLVALTHASNTLGTVNPIKHIIEGIKKTNPQVAILIDGAQAVPHFEPDVQNLDCDFYTFSGHKLFGPTGIGVLYAKEKWLQQFNTYQSGGGTIVSVNLQNTTFASSPLKYEAGTPNISGAIALAEAVLYIQQIGLKQIYTYEQELLQYALEKLKAIPSLSIYGEAANRVPVISFNIAGLHHLDVGTLLNQFGFAVRTGHLCTQPVWEYYQVKGAIRLSLAFYNTKKEIDAFMEALLKCIKMLS